MLLLPTDIHKLTDGQAIEFSFPAKGVDIELFGDKEDETELLLTELFVLGIEVAEPELVALAEVNEFDLFV